MEREWLIGGLAGLMVGLTLSVRLGRRHHAIDARLGRTALALGLLLAMWTAAAMG